MRRQSASVVTASALALAMSALPARAQNFLNGTAETIWSGNARLSGSPAHMLGRDGAPDNTGGAFRVGYGISDNFDLEAMSAIFDRVTLLGGDGHLRFFDDGETLASLTLGGHRALVKNGLDSTALDLAAALRISFFTSSASSALAGPNAASSAAVRAVRENANL